MKYTKNLKKTFRIEEIYVRDVPFEEEYEDYDDWAYENGGRGIEGKAIDHQRLASRPEFTVVFY